MRDSVPITEVRRNFGVFHDIALEAPVPVSKHGRETVYLISAELYRRLQGELCRVGLPADLLQPAAELTPPLRWQSTSRAA